MIQQTRHIALVKILLVHLLCLMQGWAEAQLKKFNESFLEFDASTIPYKRCVLEVNAVQGFLADTGVARFTR